jgi:hypothetical protein
MSFDRWLPRFEILCDQALFYGTVDSIIDKVDVFHVCPVESGTNRGNFEHQQILPLLSLLVMYRTSTKNQPIRKL